MSETIDVATAVREIISTTRQRTAKDPSGYPFFFIVGAGISAPMIPIASRIEAICRESAEGRGLAMPALSEDPMERYEKLMTLIHPSAAERQEFFYDLIHDAPVSPANLRLAHVLESRLLTDLVVTPNFDEMLTKALRLFGVDYVVCDDPRRALRIKANRTDRPQIVHVHGTYQFYDCCNLKAEIAARADNASMSGLLGRILIERSPIVIGYSGWSTDVIMTALERWSEQEAWPYNLYWFCHRASEIDRLPPWLRKHVSVRFVVESEAIDASALFATMIKETNASAPVLTRDPLGFFALQLEKFLGSTQDANDIYLMAQVIASVRRGSELVAAEHESLSEAKRRMADAVTRLSDAVRRTADDEVLKTVAEIEASALTIDQCVEVDAALTSFHRSRVVKERRKVLQIVPLWQSVVERALEAAPDDPDRQSSAARALLVEAFCSEGRENQVLLLRRLLDRFGHLNVVNVANAMANLASILSETGQKEEAKALRQILRERFKGEAAMETSLDISTMNELIGTGDLEGTVSVAEELAKKYAGRSDHTGLYLHGVALMVRAQHLLLLHRWDETAIAADEFLQTYLNDFNEADVIRVLLHKAYALAQLGRRAEATAIVTEADKRMNRSDPTFAPLLTIADNVRGLIASHGNREDPSPESREPSPDNS